ncbi:hypothetical protein BAY61_15605 [Prauserella marina]|nr:hypothetical protein BAY61_15605 [Prauserella marina]
MPLIFHVAGTGERLTVSPERLVIAGYTAKDETSVAAHIAELAEIGVPAPPSVPAFYDLDPALLTPEPVVEVSGAKTSGEVEPVIIRHEGRFFLAVGSDHTDREIERTGIAESKAACPKPVGGTVADIGSVRSGLSTLDWDGVLAEADVDGQPYQKGAISTLRYPSELLERMTATLGEVTGDLVLFCGTLPLPGGRFEYGTSWRIRVELPDGTALSHAYEATPPSG